MRKQQRKFETYFKFEKEYEQTFIKELGILELERKVLLRQAIKKFFCKPDTYICLLVFICCLAFVVYNFCKVGIFFASFDLFVIFLLISVLFDSPAVRNSVIFKTNEEFTEKLKNKLFSNVKIFRNITYVPKKLIAAKSDNFSLISLQDIKDSMLFPLVQENIVDDVFYGTKDDISFCINESAIFSASSGKIRNLIMCFYLKSNFKAKVHVVTKVDKQKRKIPVLYWLLYAGCFIACIFATLMPFTQCYFLNRQLSGCHLEFENFFVLIVCCLLPLLLMFFTADENKNFIEYSKNMKTFKKINLEDVKFANRFKVYSTDEICARLVATPAFMEKLLNLKTAFGVKNLKCSFFDNVVMIVISRKKNHFEFGNLFTNLINPDKIFNVYKEIEAIYDIMDCLKLGKQ